MDPESEFEIFRDPGFMPETHRLSEFVLQKAKFANKDAASRDASSIYENDRSQSIFALP